MSCEALVPAEGGARLSVRLAPRSSSDRVMGAAAEADGATVLKVAVTAPPEDGKANQRLIALLAKLFSVPKSDIALLQGATQRRKLLFIKGDPGRLAGCLDPFAR